MGGLLIVELVAMSTWLDTATLQGRSGLTRLIGDWGPVGVQWLVAFSALWLALLWRAAKRNPRVFSDDLGEIIPNAYWPLLGHAGSLILLGGLSVVMFHEGSLHSRPNLLAGSFLAAGILAAISAAWVFFPLEIWVRLLRETRVATIYAALVALGACLFGTASHALWSPTAQLTFRIVAALLRPLIPDLAVNPMSLTIGGKGFSVMIAPECSGLEGVGLMLIFATAWLWFFRNQYRFPYALLLLPVSVGLIWVLNALRIAALVLIGNAGAPGVAAGGFHSQAGWIAFNAVAIGLVWILPRVAWLRKDGKPAVSQEGSNPTAGYLVPFLAILMAAMLSRAVASRFEWLYPLRLITCAAALWCYRSYYRGFEVGRSAVGVVIGSVVFVIWIILDGAAGPHDDHAMASWLAGFSLATRTVWIVLRIVTAVVIVPIAEELAFRGFLFRRLVSTDFESVFVRGRFCVSALAISSLAFGALHGEQWIAGTIAGALYGFAFIWRGRLWDAIVAHACTNAVIAAWVIVNGSWHLW